jgi:preprotein translocase subunit SecG
VTQAQIAELIQLLDRRFDRVEHAINRSTAIFGTLWFVQLLLDVLLLRKIAL